MVIRSKPLCRHVLRNRHKFMHFLQRQIRLCSSRIAQPLESAVEFDENIKVIDIPKATFQTQSLPIQHEPGNGHLFMESDLYARLATPNQLQPKPDADALAFDFIASVKHASPFDSSYYRGNMHRVLLDRFSNSIQSFRS